MSVRSGSSSGVRRIAVITGTRAEYGTLRPLLRALSGKPNVALHVIATGMHLLPKFGRTVNDIIADGFRPAGLVPMQRGDGQPLDQAFGLGRGVEGLARRIAELKSDTVVVLGDRIEAMAGALAAVTTGRLLVHIHGGDVAPGDFDDALRHAITKLAHVHFAATDASARRIIALGEDPRNVYACGAPGLDVVRETARLVKPRPPQQRAAQALVIYHAFGRSETVEERTATRILSTVRAAGLRRTVIFPNSDRGHAGVIRAICAHAEQFPGEVILHRSLPRDEFLATLLTARVLVGNSSCGLIEAPFAGTPVVNVGGRQAGRQPGGRGIHHCSETKPAIAAAIRAALADRLTPGTATVYGDGRAGPRMARTLLRIRPELARQPKLLRVSI